MALQSNQKAHALHCPWECFSYLFIVLGQVVSITVIYVRNNTNEITVTKKDNGTHSLLTSFDQILSTKYTKTWQLHVIGGQHGRGDVMNPPPNFRHLVSITEIIQIGSIPT
jgi:hypothetical protein